MADLDGNIDDLIEAYLKGQLDENTQRQVEQMIYSDSSFAEMVKLQAQIEGSLKRLFTPPSEIDLSFLSDQMESVSVDDRHTEPGSQSRKVLSLRQRSLLLAVAASVAWIAVAWQLWWSGKENLPDLAFRQRPLTEVYDECVAGGFEPYWVCDNERMFAATFETRQGVPLNLFDLPEGSRMVGLSYLGGISRESTSLLATVDETPVIVFVDRLDRDWKPPIGFFSDSGLTVTRTEKEGLVLYEVSPLKQTVIINYLRRSSADMLD